MPRPRRALTLSILLTTVFGCAKSTDEWLNDLRGEDEFQRLLAATSLRVDPPEGRAVDAAAELLNILEDPNDDVADAAKAALTHLAETAPQALAEVMATTEVVRYPGAPPAIFIRHSAAHFLTEAGAIDALLSVLNDRDAADRGLAATSLGRIGPAAVEALVEVLSTTDDPHTRNLAAMGLGRALAVDPGAAHALLDGVPSGSPAEMALEVIRRSAQYHAPAEYTASWVRERLRRWRSDEPAESVGAGVELRLAGDALIPLLVEILSSGAPPDAPAAAMFLFQMGMPGLIQAFRVLDPDQPVHRQLLMNFSLGLADPTAALPILLMHVESGDDAMARKAALVLGGMGPSARAAIDPLRRRADGDGATALLRADLLGAVARLSAGRDGDD